MHIGAVLRAVVGMALFSPCSSQAAASCSYDDLIHPSSDHVSGSHGHPQHGSPPASAVEAMLANCTKLVKGKSANKAGDAGATLLVNTLLASSSTNAMHEINFNDEDIGDEGARAFARLLQADPLLGTLRLEKNRITDEGAVALYSALKYNTHIKSLYMGSNQQLTDKAAEAAAEALRLNKPEKMEALKLFDIKGIGDKGAAAVAEAMKVNTAIFEMNLAGCSIGDQGAIALADALRVNNGCKSRLHKYYLHNNRIGDRGALALADAIAHGHCMLAVHLNGNSNISESSKNALRAAWNASNGRPTRLVLDPEPAKPSASRAMGRL